MPNWCTNTVTFRGTPEDRAAFRELMGADRRAFDFEALAPMPPELMACNDSDETAWRVKYGEWATDPWWGANHYPTRAAALQAARHPENAERWYFRDFSPPHERHGRDVPRTFDEAADMAQANVLAHGHVCWYGWRCEHWGTKWNACGVGWPPSGDAETVAFDTAWGPPLPVFELLSRRFPLAGIVAEYDEMQMGFRGRVALAGGIVTDHNHENYDWHDEPWANQ